MYKILTQITLVFTLATFTAVAIKAQDDLVDDERIASTHLYSGVESAAGTLEPLSSISYNNTYVLTRIEKHESHYLTVSLNHFSAIPDGIVGSRIMGGAWSLVVTRDGQYVGTVFGDVMGGSIDFTDLDYKRPKKLSKAILSVTGWMGLFEVKSRKKIIGKLNLTTDVNFRKTKASLDLTF
jgi:hypothetical protein